MDSAKGLIGFTVIVDILLTLLIIILYNLYVVQ